MFNYFLQIDILTINRTLRSIHKKRMHKDLIKWFFKKIVVQRFFIFRNICLVLSIILCNNNILQFNNSLSISCSKFKISIRKFFFMLKKLILLTLLYTLLLLNINKSLSIFHKLLII